MGGWVGGCVGWWVGGWVNRRAGGRGEGGREEGWNGLNSCGNILNGSEHSSLCNVVIFTQNLHHHAHVTGVSEVSVSHSHPE